METTRQILERRTPQAESAIERAEIETARILSAHDALIQDLEPYTATLRQHLAFEIEKAELAIERAEWESRADTAAPRERVARLRTTLETISPEALLATRRPLAEIWRSLADLQAGT